MPDYHRTPRNQLNSREREFLRTVRNLPRPYPDPAIEWQLTLYSQLTRTKRMLDRFPTGALLSNQHLKSLRIVRGADLNVDEDDPVDLEARFFMPAPGNPLRDMHELHQRGFAGWAEPGFLSEIWNYFDEKLLPAIRLLRYYHAVVNVVEKSYPGTQPSTGSNPYWLPASFKKFNPTRIQRFTDRFWIQDFYHYRSPDGSGPDPATPHSIMSLIDTSIGVPDDQILKSELMTGILCMRHILTLRHWPGHYTLPILILSYHNGRGRIIQMHCENHQVHIRMSRHLYLRRQKIMHIPQDGLIMTKWFLSKPIGSTAFSSLPDKDGHEEDSGQKRPHQGPGTSWPLEISKEEHGRDAVRD